MTPPHDPYVLVTAARNEVDFIELTIKSVIAQTVPPVLWVIVSDGSDDGTDELVQSYAERHEHIRLVRRDESLERNTAAKVHAINTGIKELEDTEYAYIGNLDADISFEEKYFETLLQRFQNDRELGVIGGRIHQVDARGGASEARASTNSVAGAVQFFRRECFEQIGGYRPIAQGMEDGVAEITARYHAWKTRSYRDLPVLHHRELGTVGRSIYQTRFSNGVTEYLVGYSFVYHVLRAFSRVHERPHVIGSALLLAGYLWGIMSQKPPVVPNEIVRFIHAEQRARLLALLHWKRQK